MSLALTLHHVRCVRADAAGQPVAILRDACVEIPAGSFTVVLGPSGSGKTTLLRLFNRLDDPSEGEVWVGDRRASEWDVLELRRQVAFVFQTPVALEETVADDVAYGLTLRDASPEEARAAATAALERVGLGAAFLDRRSDGLSVGQQQRVALARALVGRPCAILADEPTSALDAASARAVLELLQALNRDDGLTVALVTHDLALAERVAERIALIIDGEVVEQSPAAAFFAGPTTERGRAFLAAATESSSSLE